MTDSKKILDYMDNKALSIYWVQRRRITWLSFLSLWIILALESFGIDIAHADTFIWGFIVIILAYFIGNAVTDISRKI